MANDAIYWDACAFIHLLQRTPQYLDALQETVARAQGGDLRIITSAVSLAEVCKLPEQGVLPLEQTKKILTFFENDYVVTHMVDYIVGEEAHHIIRLHGLRPMDAIHIATALVARESVNVISVVTTDTKKYRRHGLLAHDGKIGNPPLRISLPSVGGFLPLLRDVEKK